MNDDNMSSHLMQTTVFESSEGRINYETALLLIQHSSNYWKYVGLAALAGLVDIRDKETMRNFFRVKTLFKTHVNQNEDIVTYILSLIGFAACLSKSDQIIELFPVTRQSV